jgi:hypothetical protein
MSKTIAEAFADIRVPEDEHGARACVFVWVCDWPDWSSGRGLGLRSGESTVTPVVVVLLDLDLPGRGDPDPDVEGGRLV